jgi:excisionase family DNA binding protein
LCTPELDVAHGAHVARVMEERYMATDDPRSLPSGALYTVAEVAAAMRISNMTVYRLIKRGELPAVRVGKNYRIRERDLERFLRERSVRVEGA